MDPLKTQSYDFELPQDRIATKPANPKDSSKLLVYDRKTNLVTHTTFKNILYFIPKDTSIVLNDTKVIKARLFGKKSSGGKIELLINKPFTNNEIECYIRGKVKIGTTLIFDNNLSANVIFTDSSGIRRVQFFYNQELIGFDKVIEIIESIGHIPLPPYMNREDNKDDEKNYQTIFAKNKGAVAAPTASLHFTTELFDKMTKEFNHNYITLHVGAGTFKPVESEDILNHPMHTESYYIPTKTQKLLDSNKPILAIGTTVTRTIEYYIRKQELQGEANLFLHPNNKPLRVNYLLTNFHLPKSTLLMLVASFVGIEKTKELYDEAIKNNYRFYSYGDAMLII